MSIEAGFQTSKCYPRKVADCSFVSKGPFSTWRQVFFFSGELISLSTKPRIPARSLSCLQILLASHRKWCLYSAPWLTNPQGMHLLHWMWGCSQRHFEKHALMLPSWQPRAAHLGAQLLFGTAVQRIRTQKWFPVPRLFLPVSFRLPKMGILLTHSTFVLPQTLFSSHLTNSEK